MYHALGIYQAQFEAMGCRGNRWLPMSRQSWATTGRPYDGYMRFARSKMPFFGARVGL